MMRRSHSSSGRTSDDFNPKMWITTLLPLAALLLRPDMCQAFVPVKYHDPPSSSILPTFTTRCSPPSQHSTFIQLHMTPAHIATTDKVLATFATPNAVILDVRSQPEIDTQGIIQTHGRPWLQTSCTPMECPSLRGAAHVMFPDPNVPIIVHCSSGMRAAKAKEVLDDMGYRNVINAGAYEDLGYLQLAADKAQPTSSTTHNNNSNPLTATTTTTTPSPSTKKTDDTAPRQKSDLPIVDACTTTVSDHHPSISSDEEIPTNTEFVATNAQHDEGYPANAQQNDERYPTKNAQPSVEVTTCTTIGSDYDDSSNDVYATNTHSDHGFPTKNTQPSVDAATTTTTTTGSDDDDDDTSDSHFVYATNAHRDDEFPTNTHSDEGLPSKNTQQPPVSGWGWGDGFSVQAAASTDSIIEGASSSYAEPPAVVMDDAHVIRTGGDGWGWGSSCDKNSNANLFIDDEMKHHDTTAVPIEPILDGSQIGSNGNNAHASSSAAEVLMDELIDHINLRYEENPFAIPKTILVEYVGAKQPRRRRKKQQQQQQPSASQYSSHDARYGAERLDRMTMDYDTIDPTVVHGDAKPLQQHSSSNQYTTATYNEPVMFVDDDTTTLQPTNYDPVAAPGPRFGVNAPDNPDDFVFEQLEPSIFDESYHGERDLASGGGTNAPDDPDQFFSGASLQTGSSTNSNINNHNWSM